MVQETPLPQPKRPGVSCKRLSQKNSVLRGRRQGGNFAEITCVAANSPSRSRLGLALERLPPFVRHNSRAYGYCGRLARYFWQNTELFL